MASLSAPTGTSARRRLHARGSATTRSRSSCASHQSAVVIERESCSSDTPSKTKHRGIVPPGTSRSDWNFSLEFKRVLNFENVVTDDDNVKQDMSIDVYGRKKEEEEEEAAAAAK